MAEIREELKLEDKFSPTQNRYISGMEKAAQKTVNAQNAAGRMTQAAKKMSGATNFAAQSLSSLKSQAASYKKEIASLETQFAKANSRLEELKGMGFQDSQLSSQIAEWEALGARLGEAEDEYSAVKRQIEEITAPARMAADAARQQAQAERESSVEALRQSQMASRAAQTELNYARAANTAARAQELRSRTSNAEAAAQRGAAAATQRQSNATRKAGTEASRAAKDTKKLTDQMNKLSKANPGKSLVRQFTRVAATLFSVRKILSFLRNSMEAMPEESKAPWDNLKKSVSQFFQSGISYLLKGMIPGMEKLNQVMNNPTGQKFAAVFRELAQEAGKAIGEIMSGIAWLVSQLGNDFQKMRSKTDILIQGFRLVGNAVQWVKSNWSMLVPVIQAAVTVILVYKGAAMLAAAAQAVLNGAMQMNPWVLFVSLMVAATQASGPLRTAILLVAAAVGVLNLILNGNPIMLIITAIGWLVMKIYDWVQAVGGLQIAWKIAVDWILTAWDTLKLGWETGVAWVQNLVDQLCLIWSIAATAVANAVGDMKVWALTQLQNLINGAIGLINNFIELLNKIPGVNIQAIGEMTFATEAAAENEAAKQAREADLAAKQAETAANRSAREQKLTNMANDAAANHMQRQGEIAAMQAAQKIGAAAQAGIKAVEGAAQDSSFMNQYGSSAVNDIGSSVGGSLGSDVSAIKKEVSLSEEELQSLVDMAQRQYVNQINLTAQTPIINIKGQNTGDTAKDRQALADVLRDILIEQSSAGTYRSTARVY